MIGDEALFVCAEECACGGDQHGEWGCWGVEEAGGRRGGARGKQEGPGTAPNPGGTSG